jgi:hypothetical protein
MTIGDWLDQREPKPPPELMTAIRKALGSDVDADAEDAAAVLLTAAERGLRQIVGNRETGRPIADDLLAVDALTTYALEAAAETLKSLGGFADEAMKRFGGVPSKDPGSTPPPA